MLYIVKREPRGKNAEIYRHMVVIVEAESKSEAVRNSGLNVSTHAEFLKPVAEPLELGKTYFI